MTQDWQSRARSQRHLASEVHSSKPLLATKLFVPQLGPIVPRSHLLARMEEGTPRALTLVSAPPGYGKTTFVVDWLRRATRPFTWLALDDGDNDPARFFTYLVAALQKIDEKTGQGAQSLLAMPQFPPVETLVTALINDVAAIPISKTATNDSLRKTPSKVEPCLRLVLDDYHVIRAPAIHAAMEFLIEHLPPNLHLVLITREDPPFSLARLRVRGQLAEIRADDLRFSPEEATCFFKQGMPPGLDDRAVGVLEARTEGWIAGLQLAALSLQGLDAERVAEFLQAFGGSNRFVMDYLLDQVLQRQSADTREFLCQTAILDRFSAAICDAVTGRADSKALLGQLQQANLFLVPLDSRREWYRYHHLFADFLRTEGDAAQQAGLYQKAAHWYAAHHSLDEAIEHACAGKDFTNAAQWIEQIGGDAFERGQVTTLTRWLDQLPEAIFHTHPKLTVLKGWTLFLTGQIAATKVLVGASEHLGTEADAVTRGRFLALRAELARLAEDLRESERLAQKALVLIGDADRFFQALIWMALGDVQNQSGDTATATRTFRQAAEIGQKLGHPFAALVPLLSLVPNLNRQGRRHEALGYCMRALEQHVDAHGKPLPFTGLLYAPLGMLYYEANELERARDYVLRGLATLRALGMDRIVLGDGEWTLARIQWAMGETDAALATAREARLAAQQSNLPRMAFVLAGVEADLLLKLGDIERAAQWAEGAHLALDILPNPAYEIVYFAWARILLAQQRLDEAQILLGNLMQFATQGRRAGRLITIYILQALAHHALGNQAIAVDRLESAVQLAAHEEYRRAFLDEGPTVAGLLPRVRHVAPAFVDSLLKDDTPSHPSSPIPHPLPEPLSERELQVLRLLADGKSNAEIAQALVVTVGTAKWHVHHVLEKLGVSNRTQAVTRARQLNLL